MVVYKVDRLTRSLTDFARIVDVLDENGVSFVSVTQSFSSMGRLTLNVLLSFAQFEREVTGERIRDKIAASKKKGMWMGGTPPLGYRPHERTLVIDEAEAATVRHIFERYISLRSVHALKAELEERGIRSRPSKRSGNSSGAPFSRGALYHLLSNRLYIGEIVHKDASYPGQHPSIIERKLFEEVAGLLAANRQERQERTVTVARAPLTGLLVGRDDRPLCPVAARNGRGRIYRYYVSAHLQQGGRRLDNDNGLRIPAPVIEALVLDRLRSTIPAITDWTTARAGLLKVTIDDNQLTILASAVGRLTLRNLDPDDQASILEDGTLRITTPMRITSWAGRIEILRSANERAYGETRIDRSLVRGLARAHALVLSVKASPDRTIEDLAKSEGLTPSYVRRLSRLTFLAPDIQQAIVDGRQPLAFNLERLMRIDLPLSWPRQRELLGFESA